MAQLLAFAYPKPTIELAEWGHPPAVTFELADGGCLSLPYEGSQLMRFRPDPETVTMQFPELLVAMRGYLLTPVWWGLRLRRAKILRASLGIGRLARDEDEPRIDSMSVLPLPAGQVPPTP